jgi:phosphate transport system substrate-binding protein
MNSPCTDFELKTKLDDILRNTGMTLTKKFRTISTAAFVMTISCTTAIIAQEVDLKRKNGELEISGRLVNVTEEYFTIETSIGLVNVIRSDMDCFGPGCPKEQTESVAIGFDQTLTTDVFFFGSDLIGDQVVPLLLSGYANAEDAILEAETVAPTGVYQGKVIGEGGFGVEGDSFTIVPSTSADAFANLMGGFADIGMSARRILPREAQLLRADGSSSMVDPRNEHFLAVDSVVIITNPENPIQRIEIDDFRSILTGEINNWSQLGGEDAPINVVLAPPANTTRSFVENRLLERKDVVAPQSLEVVSGDVEIANTVNEDLYALGYVSYAFQRGAQAIDLVSECGIEHKPDTFSSRTEEYPLQRFLYLYSRDDRLSPATNRFLQYATSSAADEVIAKSGYIDLGIEKRVLELTGTRAQQLLSDDVDAYEGSIMREMLSTMANSERMSSTFRYLTGSSNLNKRGKLNLVRLVDFLEAQPDGTEVNLVGFTDDVGAFSSNLSLAERRATELRAAITEVAGDRLSQIKLNTIGFGETAPVACNTTEEGRAINRRVEVWIKKAT